MYKFFNLLSSGLILLFLTSCAVSETTETAALKTPAAPGPGDCDACHESGEALPQGHVDTAAMNGNACGACHAGTAGLRTKIPLGHIHQLKGVSCKECHEDPSSAMAADSGVCKRCHDNMALLIESTNDLAVNPHFSPHEGSVPDCNRCHHQHKGSENICAGCHNLEYKVP